MSNYPPTSHYGSPFSFPNAQPPYAPAPPPQHLPYNVLPPQQQQPYAQHRAPLYGQPLPPNGTMIQHANTGAFHNNANYHHQGHNPSFQPQPPPSHSYYHYQPQAYPLGAVFNAPAPYAAHNSTPAPPGLSQGPAQAAHPSTASTFQQAGTGSNTPSLLRPPGTAETPKHAFEHVPSAQRGFSVAPKSPISTSDFAQQVRSARLQSEEKRDTPPVGRRGSQGEVTSGAAEEDTYLESLERSQNGLAVPPAASKSRVNLDTAQAHPLPASKPPEAASPITLGTPSDNSIVRPSKASREVDSRNHSREAQDLSDTHIPPNSLAQSGLGDYSRDNSDQPEMVESSGDGSEQGELAEPAGEIPQELRRQKRDEAKRCIQWLHDHGFTFQQITNEGIDQPLLRGIYEELQIELPPSTNSNGRTIPPSIQSNQQADTNVPKTAPLPLRFPSPPRSATQSGITNSVDVPFSANPPKDSSSAVGPISSLVSDQPQVQAASPLPRKPSVKVPPTKPLDRKDYIAKLLAAKATVKQQASTKPDQNALSKSPPVQETPVQILESKQATTPSVSTAVAASAEASPTLETLAEMRKSDAKTQLVRQRLEALKGNASIQPLPPRPSRLETAATVSSAVHAEPSRPADGLRRVKEPASNAPPPASAAAPSQGSPRTPDASFFAIGNRRSFGGLPGLGGFNAPPSAPAPSSATIEASSGPADSFQRSAPAIEALNRAPAPASSQSTLPVNPPAPVSASEAADTAPSDAALLPTALPTTTVRKRATALDFIDVPEASPKRQMMSKDPISLVIEVSDDEDDGPSVTGHQKPLSLSQAPARSESAPKSFRDGPPLSNVPSRPGATPTTGKPPEGHQARGLAQTEEQIRLLQQKIAEMEQRKKAKQASGTPRADSAPAPAAVSLLDMSKDMESERQTLEASNRQLAAQQETLVAAQSEVQESLDAGRKSQAKLIEKAEAAARAAKRATTQKQKQERLARKAQLEAALPRLNAQMDSGQRKLDEMIKQQEQLRAEIERGIEGRNSLIQELDALADLLEDDLDESPVPEDALRDEIEDASGNALEAETRASESSHPALAEADSAPEAMSIEQSSSSSHDEGLPGHPSSRQASIEALLDDSGVATMAPQLPQEAAVEATTMDANMDISNSSADEGQIFESGRSPEDPQDPEEDSLESGEEYQPPSAGFLPAYRSVAGLFDKSASSQRRSVSETDDDASMDIEVEPEADDEYEPDEFEPKGLEQSHQSLVQDEPIIVDSSESEDPDAPTGGASIVQDYGRFPHITSGQSLSETDQSSTGAKPSQPVSFRVPDATPGATEMPTDHVLPSGPIPPSEDDDQEEGEIDEEASDERPEPPRSSDPEQGETAKAVAGGNIEDDAYEPPEPSPPLQDLPATALQPAMAPSPQQQTFTMSPQMTGPIEAPTTMNDGHAGESARSYGVREGGDPAQPGMHTKDALQPASHAIFSHYTPYESPLSRFNSYRFHPQYVNAVPGGFRSLTYSHRIDPKQPLCQWEVAGGVCNDSSCNLQHFRSMPLTDNSILLQLGSSNEGATPAKREAYITGLKQIIAGMRDRKLRDISAVASEIVAFRSQFLGDSSRVLTGV